MSALPVLNFDLPAPDLGAWRSGNTGIEGVWQFDSHRPGRHVMISALVHGNEVCGAWALKDLLEAGVRVGGQAGEDMQAEVATVVMSDDAMMPGDVVIADVSVEETAVLVAPMPKRVLPHQLAEHVADRVRGMRHESSGEMVASARSDGDEAIDYGLWWHETMEFMPWGGAPETVAAE